MLFQHKDRERDEIKRTSTLNAGHGFAKGWGKEPDITNGYWGWRERQQG
jgi:hypothetical protein